MPLTETQFRVSLGIMSNFSGNTKHHMSHGIETARDFVYGLAGQGKDWHGKTQEVPTIHRGLFPDIIMLPLWFGETREAVRQLGTRRVLVTTDDNQPIGEPFNQKSFGFITPQAAWDTAARALSGTSYRPERVGMLKDRSFWFVSIHLAELAEVARPGEAFQLNFSGALDGTTSPQWEVVHFRAVCWNTISLSRATGKVLFKLKQTANAQGRLVDAEAEISEAVGMARIFNETLRGLESKPLSTPDARALFAAEATDNGQTVEKAVNRRSGKINDSRGLKLVDHLTGLFLRGDGNKGETRADALNAFTQRFTRGSNEPEKSRKNPYAAIESSEFGAGADRKARFLKVLADDTRFGEAVDRGRKVLASVN